MAVVLRYYESLNYQEIASALETTPKAVERLLARGRDRLQAILKTSEDF
jgi:DNA-directed RNA polymerase specialized sigma24 family protein